MYERHIARAHANLDEPAFATAWAEGRAMMLDQATNYALSDFEALDLATPRIPAQVASVLKS